MAAVELISILKAEPWLLHSSLDKLVMRPGVEELKARTGHNNHISRQTLVLYIGAIRPKHCHFRAATVVAEDIRGPSCDTLMPI